MLSAQTLQYLTTGVANQFAANEINSALGGLNTRGVPFYVSNSTINLPGFAPIIPLNANDGLSPFYPKLTIQAAITAAAAVPGSVVIINPGSYNETVTIPRGAGPLTIIGNGNGGNAGIAPTTAAARGMTINSDDVTLINVDIAGNATADFGLFSTGSRLRAYNCKFEGPTTSGAAIGIGPGTVAQVAAGTTGNAGDIQIFSPVICWSFNGLALVTSDYGTPTQVEVVDAWYHNVSNTCVMGVPAAFGIGSVRNLNHRDGLFGRMEDGTKPADFINVATAFDTGSFSGNRFELATNAAADIKIGAAIFWPPNGTEAGWSTARPA